jgi:tetratricopeptide (TPR) repeat protein
MAQTDPAAKIREAGELLAAGRPIFAERLIREAMEAYEASGDELGRANAYRAYAFFLRSSALDRNHGYYAKNGFLDKTVKFEERYSRSLEYFEKARALYVVQERFDAVANIDLNIGLTQATIGERAAACKAFERSLENHRENQRRHPDAKPLLPPKVATYEEYVNQQQAGVGCSDIAAAPTAAPVAAVAAAPSASAKVTLQAAWLDKVKVFPAESHFIYLVDATSGRKTKAAELIKAPFRDGTASSAVIELPTGVPLKLVLQSQHTAGAESACYIPFTAVLDPARAYLFDFQVKKSFATGKVTCAPRFFALDPDGSRRDFAVRMGW